MSLENARLRYEAACAEADEKAPKLLRASIPRLRQVPDEGDEPDPEEVRQARLELWRRLPLLHRTTPAKLLERIKEPSMAAAAMVWDWGSPSLLLCSPSGGAKSAAAELIPIRLMARGREREHKLWKGIRWVEVPELMSTARAWPLGSGECPDVRAARMARLLILDDLGNEEPWQTVLFEVVQYRYRNQLPNIITTGLSGPELLRRYGDGITRRLVNRDGQLGTIVDCWEGREAI